MKKIGKIKHIILILVSCSYVPLSSAVITSSSDLEALSKLISPQLERCDDIVSDGDFIEIFDCGDELFEVRFNALDGVGMDVGDGGRFSRVPRADLVNWSTTNPPRETGPNAEACNICHVPESIGGAGDGAGPAGLNVIRDPLHLGVPSGFIQRNTPHLFGMAGPQLLAEEMTARLHAIVARTRDEACSSNTAVSNKLRAKGVSFGRVRVKPPCPNPKVKLTVKGIDEDLIVKPFQWKGIEKSVRSFSRGAFHNELGMTPVELSGDGIDSDYDSVVDEISIADNTAMAVYLAAQPRPTTLLELNKLRRRLERLGSAGSVLADELLLPNLNFEQQVSIKFGERLFRKIGCARCHKPALIVNNPIFSSPSQNANYREEIFPGGQNAVANGVDPNNPITFDITHDQPDNIIAVGDDIIKRLGSFERSRNGGAIVRLFGDLKRHDMGPGLAENIDEAGRGASMWMTKELWGLAQTAPYMHDGRASTVLEAIYEHGGESAASRKNFRRLPTKLQGYVLDFLNNLVLFFPAEEE